MSLEQMIFVWKLPPDATHPTDRLVLLALADIAGETGKCWPGIPRLARKCGVTTNTVRAAIKRMKEAGYVTIEERTRTSGGRTSHMYTLHVAPANAPPLQTLKGGPSVVEGGPPQPLQGAPANIEGASYPSSTPTDESPPILGSNGGGLLEQVVADWNDAVGEIPSLPKIIQLTSKRKTSLKARLEEPTFRAKYHTLFEMVTNNPFLCGRATNPSHPNFKADFDWLIRNDTNYVKVLEGKYDDNLTENPAPHKKVSPELQREFEDACRRCDESGQAMEGRTVTAWEFKGFDVPAEYISQTHMRLKKEEAKRNATTDADNAP